MAQGLSPPGPIGITALLFLREARGRLASVWLYAVATGVCLIAWLYGAGFQQTFQTESVLVTTDPLMALNILVVVFVGLVLGLRLAATFAWEREHRTLEVLLVGPVPWGAILAAKFLVEVCVLALLTALYAAYLVLAQPLGQGVIAPSDTLGLLTMPVFALPLLALGLVVSAWARTVRGAVVMFIVVFGCLAVFQIAFGLLSAEPPDQMSLTALYLRSLLEWAAPVVQSVSAAGQLAVLVRGLTEETPLSATAEVWSLGLCLASLIAATLLARLRGAQ